MKRKLLQSKVINRLLPEKTFKTNSYALKSFDYYKRTSEIIDRTNLVLGKKKKYISDFGSTLSIEIDRNAISSTTA